MAFIGIVGLLLLVSFAGAIYAIWTDVAEEEHADHVASHEKDAERS